MAFPAFLDTNVLYGATLCDTMLRIAEHGAFRPHWSKDALGELVEVLVRHAGMSRTRADRRIAAMQRAFPLAAVEDYDLFVDAMTCDPKIGTSSRQISVVTPRLPPDGGVRAPSATRRGWPSLG